MQLHGPESCTMAQQSAGSHNEIHTVMNQLPVCMLQVHGETHDVCLSVLITIIYIVGGHMY